MNPLVSCLCPTKSHPKILKRAIDCFNDQTYEKKELILVSNEFNPYIEDVKRFTNKNIKLFSVPEGMALGAIRNISVSNANGEYINFLEDYKLEEVKKIDYDFWLLTISTTVMAFVSLYYFLKWN